MFVISCMPCLYQYFNSSTSSLFSFKFHLCSSFLPTKTMASQPKQLQTQPSQNVAIDKPIMVKPQSPQKKKNQSFEIFKNGFLKSVKPIELSYQCYACGLKQTTLVFQKRRFHLARLCKHNIDLDIAQSCDGKEKDRADDEIIREYTNWDMEFEMTSPYEIDQYSLLWSKWMEWNVQAAKTGGPRFKWLKDQIEHRMKIENAIVAFKKVFIKDVLKKTNNVNTRMLEGTLRRCRAYLKMIDYWLKIHRLFNYKDNPLWNMDSTGNCYACGMDCYLATQYEKAYIAPYARQVLHLVDDYVKSGNFFVCGKCIMECWGYASQKYRQLQITSLLYAADWNTIDHTEKTLFILGHLNHKHFPMHIGWYDMNDEVWKYGPITEVTKARQHVLQVSVHNYNNNKKIILPFGSMDECEYFIFQRPSSKRSPLYKLSNPKWDEMFYSQKNTVLNITHPQLLTRYAVKKQMYRPGRDTMRNDWALPIVHQGENCETWFLNVMHFKDIFLFLRNNDLLKNEQRKQKKRKKQKHNVNQNNNNICRNCQNRNNNSNN